MADILRQIYYGRYITAEILRQIYYGRYIMAYIYRDITADILWQIYYGNYITAGILQQVYYGRYITADILRQIHYGRYIAYHKNGHISTNVQRQKLSIAASESACCNASPQGLLWTVLCCIRREQSHFWSVTGPNRGRRKVSGGGGRPWEEGVCP